LSTFWVCKTTTNSNYNKKIIYISEPSIDLIDHFKDQIVTYQDPTKHPDYVPCTHIAKSKGYMLFVLKGRVEVLIKPDTSGKKLLFMDCNDN
jgi:hypothetical protein